MAGLNKVILIGRVGKEPEIKNFQNGGSIANFSMATSETWKDRTTGEKKETTDWHNISVGGPLVDIVQKYVHKGNMLSVEGKLRTRSWEKDGKTNYITEVIVSNLILLEKQNSSSGSSGGYTAEAAPAADGSSIDEMPF